jgi:hypothetical protein
MGARIALQLLKSTDRGIMGSGVSDVLLLNVGSDGLQDLQEFGTVSSAVQESGSKVSGHQIEGGEGLLGVFEGAPVPVL